MFANTYHLRWIAGRGNIVRKYIYICFLKYIFFQLWMWLLRFLFCHFRKLQLLVIKNSLKLLLLHSSSICISSNRVSQIFKTLFRSRNINIFVLRAVFFSRHVQVKSFFSNVKNISAEILDTS